MTELAQAELIIYSSENGRTLWEPVLPSLVPEFVKHPDVMGRLVSGEMCCDVAEGGQGSLWYRAERVADAHA